jgi:E3 ubiquitin-protein ligase UBR3
VCIFSFQSLFYEILSGIWVRNGLQIKGQAMTYIQANFCNSMVDMDMFFLQICATQLPANFFLTAAIDIFGVNQWLGMGPLTSPQEMEQDSMLEGLLTFLATLVISRTNLGNDEQTQCIIEISALLATGDKTHSQLLELMPERSGNAHTRSFEKFLKELSVYRPPPLGSENLEQGLFMPTAKVWEEYYDPLHVLLRAVHRRDFQNSMDRFSNYVKQEKKMPTSGSLWPPFRLPTSVGTEYGDPASVLNSKVLHATILGIFYRAVHTHSVSEHLLALGVFLLEMAVGVEERLKKSDSAMEACPHSSTSSFYGEGEAPELLHCFPGNNLSENLRLMVTKVSLRSMEPHQSPVNYNNAQFDSDLEWDVSEGDTLPILAGGRSIENAGGVDDGDSNSSALAIISHGNVGIIQGTPSTMEIAVPQDLSIVRENSLVVHGNNLQIVERMDDEPSGVAHTPPSNAIQLITDIRRLDSMSSSSSTSSYPPPGTAALPPIPPVISTATVDGGLEVAIRDQTGETSRSRSRSTPEMFSSNSSNSVMILPFNRVQPVAVPNRSLDIMPGVTNSSGGAQQPRRILLSNSGTTTTTTSGGAGGGTTNVQHRKHVDTGALESSAVAGEIGSSADQQPTDPDTVVINESILSLLLKLHSQLSGTLDSFSLEDETEDEKMDADDGDEQPTTSTQQQQSSQQKSHHSPKVIKISDSRLGDGPHFIGNLLKKLAKYDPQCAQSINDIRHKLWPNQRERQAELKAREAKEKEERTKRARERQRKLMQEFANKQKQFMAQAMESEIDMEGIDDDEDELLEAAREKEYDCIICNTTGPSTESNPMGLVVYVESTSLVGHRRVTDHRFPLPISDADKEMPGRGVNLATEFNNRVKLLTWKFGGNTWFLSHNINWEGGVHVQSCGHHVHLTCQDAYLKSLHTSQRPQTLNVERGEFFCPVCRQLANSVLPLSPQQDRPTPLVRTPTVSFAQQVMDLMKLMRENKRPTVSKGESLNCCQLFNCGTFKFM